MTITLTYYIWNHMFAIIIVHEHRSFVASYFIKLNAIIYVPEVILYYMFNNDVLV